MTSRIINQPADDWAKRNLVREIEIRPLHNSLFARILAGAAISFLALIFVGIPAGLFYGSAVRYAAQGWSGEVSRGLTLGGIFLLAFTALAAFLLFYVWSLRRKQIKSLTSEGVLTRGGKYYSWKSLQYLKFEKVQTEVRGDFPMRLMTRLMYSGVQKIKVVMFFADGAETAIIPPLIARQREILELLDTIPVERRYGG